MSLGKHLQAVNRLWFNVPLASSRLWTTNKWWICHHFACAKIYINFMHCDHRRAMKFKHKPKRTGKQFSLTEQNTHTCVCGGKKVQVDMVEIQKPFWIICGRLKIAKNRFVVWSRAKGQRNTSIETRNVRLQVSLRVGCVCARAFDWRFCGGSFQLCLVNSSRNRKLRAFICMPKSE